MMLTYIDKSTQYLVYICYLYSKGIHHPLYKNYLGIHLPNETDI